MTSKSREIGHLSILYTKAQHIHMELSQFTFIPIIGIILSSSHKHNTYTGENESKCSVCPTQQHGNIYHLRSNFHKHRSHLFFAAVSSMGAAVSGQ